MYYINIFHDMESFIFTKSFDEAESFIFSFFT